ncbi:MAG TPA: O-antigen ligase family protein [Candidatus Polarisedimenticolaceae bacterium]
MALRALAWGLAAFAFAAPLPFGAVGAGGRLAFEIAALLLGGAAVAAFWRRESPAPPKAALAGLAILLLLPLVQLVPLGPASAGEAPPAEAALLGVDPATLDAPARLSVDRGATASAVRTGAATALLFLAAAAVATAGRAAAPAWGLLAGAAFQALYGIAVLASGSGTIWGEPKLHYLDCATGTFVNRNHFAAYVAAGLAAGCGLAFDLLHRALRERRPGRPLFSDPRAARAALALTLAVLALAGLLLSFSRAGIALGVAAAAGTALAGSAGIASRRWRIAVGVCAVALAALPLLDVGAGRLADRYAATDEDFGAAGGRGTVWRDALRLAAAHPVAGTGLGTFAAAYPGARSPEVRPRYSHAHNDAVQLAAEGGLVAVAGLAWLLVALVPRAAAALRARHGPLATGCAAGAAAFALHALVDFPFHIPGAAAAGALLAGATTGLPWGGRNFNVVRDDPSRAGRAAAVACAGLALLAAGIATALGADTARAPSDAPDLAATAARAALERGADDAGARAALVELRRRVGARPLDGAIRAAYAGALLDVAGEDAGVRDAAVFHAGRAAASAPVSVPVVAAAARTLARAGRADAAIPLVRSMFGFDPRAAAVVLLEIEGFVVTPDAAVPELAAAWTAWGLELRRSGRGAEGNRRIEEAVARWPEDVRARTLAALFAAGDRRHDDLDALVPDALPLPADPAHATLLALRAQIDARRGDRDLARARAAAAEEASSGDPAVREIAARALLDAGDVEAARAMWTRAWWSLPAIDATRPTRLRLALSLARLEREHGRAGDARRAYRSVLEVDPENLEARRELGN